MSRWGNFEWKMVGKLNFEDFYGFLINWGEIWLKIDKFWLKMNQIYIKNSFLTKKVLKNLKNNQNLSIFPPKI